MNREELNRYWFQVISIDHVTEFGKHLKSNVLAAFLEVSEALESSTVIEVSSRNSGSYNNMFSQVSIYIDIYYALKYFD